MGPAHGPCAAELLACLSFLDKGPEARASQLQQGGPPEASEYCLGLQCGVMEGASLDRAINEVPGGVPRPMAGATEK